MFNKIKKSIIVAFIGVASVAGLNVGTAEAAVIPYGYYATEIGCVDAGLDFMNDGSGDFRGFHCFKERNGQYHLYMDEY